jgi:immune inhibitor A
MKYGTQWLKWGLVALAVSPAAWAKNPHLEGTDAEAAARARQSLSDDLPHPLGERQRQLREQGIQDKLAGKAKGKVHEVAKGRYVELALERTDRVFVVLAEFGSQVHPTYGNPATNPGGDVPGPLHNQIAQPDRATDNTTLWKPDYNREHYEQLYFSTAPGADSVATYFRTQSSGRYTLEGVVHDWVRVPFNEARYGHNLCGRRTCTSAGLWVLVRDAINVWTQDQLAAGRTPEQIKAYLDTFDVWDRYDYDQDGEFNEPDGYIDHFQLVHAGEGEETGGGAQGQNAIWSHRSFAYSSGGGHGGNGPAYNPNGGTRFGLVDKWVGDYTMQPENGGLGVFAHEYGHDLGLPDHYDTNLGYGNDSAFWTLMGHGSYLGDGTVDTGSRPGDLWAWDKLQLGWLNYEEARAGESSSHKLGPVELNTRQAQALVVRLPPQVVDQPTTPPYAGQFAWYSGQGNNLDRTMVRTVSLPSAASVQLTLRAWLDIEEDWDYAYVSVSTDGKRFENLPGNLTTQTNPNNNNFGHGITGTSGDDTSLETGPYVYSFWDMDLYNYVEHYPYEEGLLITYWNTRFNDNRVSLHPGQGRILPVDAHSTPLLDGWGWHHDTFVQVHDAPFGLSPTRPFSLHTPFGPRVEYPSLPGESVFNDLRPYWFPETFWMGVQVPPTGTVIEVVKQKEDGRYMRVNVRPAP